MVECDGDQAMPFLSVLASFGALLNALRIGFFIVAAVLTDKLMS